MRNNILLIKTLLLFMGCICLLLCINNGTLRSFVRLIFDTDYPVEIKTITSSLMEFDLSKKKPAVLALGIHYPKGSSLQTVDSSALNEVIGVKLYIDNEMKQALDINQFDRTWLDFQSSGFKVSTFYTFEWSPPFRMYKQLGDTKVVVDLNNRFQGYNLILIENKK